MAVKIRLTRRGRKKMAMYDIIIADSKSPRDGRFIEKIGTYNPNTDPSTVLIKTDRAIHWLMVGAQPTDTTRAIFSHEGLMFRKHLQVGVNKGAITQEQADEKYNQWKEGKEARITGIADTKYEKMYQERRARLEAERAVNETRAKAIVERNKVDEPVSLIQETFAKGTEPVPQEARATEEFYLVVEERSALKPIDHVHSALTGTDQIPHFKELWDLIASNIFSEEYDFLQWLLTPNDMINEEKPLMQLAEGGDLELIKRLLGRLEHGILA